MEKAFKSQRDFLKENIKNVKKLQNQLEIQLKNKLQKSEEIKQLAGKTTSFQRTSPQVNLKRMSKRISSSNSRPADEISKLEKIIPRSEKMDRLRAGKLDPAVVNEIIENKPNETKILTISESIQTFDNIEDERFFINAKILQPSIACLDAIKNEKAQSSLQKKPIVKNLDEHSSLISEHLSDLKEYFEKGSISRRREKNSITTPKHDEFEKKFAFKESMSRRCPKYEKFNPQSNVAELKQKPSRTSSSSMQARKSSSKSVQRNQTKKEVIGDGPKPTLNKGKDLVLLYKKD